MHKIFDGLEHNFTLNIAFLFTSEQCVKTYTQNQYYDYKNIHFMSREHTINAGPIPSIKIMYERLSNI